MREVYRYVCNICLYKNTDNRWNKDTYCSTSPRFTSPRFTRPRFTSPRFTSPVQSSPVLEIPYAFFSLCSSALVQFVLRNVFGLASPDKNTQTSMGTVRRIGRSGKAEKTTAQSGKYVGVVRSCQGWVEPTSRCREMSFFSFVSPNTRDANFEQLKLSVSLVMATITC